MIIGNKVILRPINHSDLLVFKQWRNNMEIKQLALMHPFPVTMEQEEDWYDNIAKSKNNKTIFFTIVEKESDKVLGFTQFLNVNWINRNCYFGIIIGDKNTQGKGYGKEVTKLMIDYGFKTLNFHKILLEVVEYNSTAIKLYKSLGFIKEGELKEHAFVNGKYENVDVYSILNKTNMSNKK